MSSEPNPASPFDKLETQSSLYEELPLDLRRQVDRAIATHQPATYQAVFDKFKLAGFGVSFTAFYRYARRIRTNAALMETAALALPEGAPVEKFLPEIVGERFLEAALDEKTSARTLHRLADAHRIAIQNHHACRRFAVQLEDEELNARKKETAGFLEAANQIAQCQANENFLQTHIANSIRAALNPADDAPIRARSASEDDSAAAGARIPSRTHSPGNPFPCPGIDVPESSTPAAAEDPSRVVMVASPARPQRSSVRESSPIPARQTFASSHEGPPDYWKSYPCPPFTGRTIPPIPPSLRPFPRARAIYPSSTRP